MSNRHYLNLKNKITGEESSVQLFGNNEWYDTFFKYLKTLNPEIADFEDSFEDVVVLNIKDLIKAVDESIWNEVIASEIHKNKNSETFVEYYSTMLDFSCNLLDGEGNARSSLYGAARYIVNYGYIMISYMVYNWLKNQGAIVNEEFIKVEHNYCNRNSYERLGELSDNFMLTISYY